ncbi:hypothetical protein [Rubritalea profundi]|uniref:Uncharacterized protein n=1 Tax=Rubritalea profundi TaxID=1658618 RepID=A0A2S7U5J3_9BACT|nr:hypothetical protein [Rubritalea profundi]PQJ29664.1 hypothetical protein BSZ32_14980 [Rubritalea profundi]
MNEKTHAQRREARGREFNFILFFLALFAPGIIILSIPVLFPVWWEYDAEGGSFEAMGVYLIVLVLSSPVASGFCCWQLTLCHPSFSTGKKVLVGFFYFIACLVATFCMGYIAGVIGITSSSPYHH